MTLAGSMDVISTRRGTFTGRYCTGLDCTSKYVLCAGISVLGKIDGEKTKAERMSENDRMTVPTNEWLKFQSASQPQSNLGSCSYRYFYPRAICTPACISRCPTLSVPLLVHHMSYLLLSCMRASCSIAHFDYRLKHENIYSTCSYMLSWLSLSLVSLGNC